MVLIPQELVDAIVGQIDDFPSLKTSALAGSILRERSQRILFQSFALVSKGSAKPDFSGARTLLDESRHIAAYIICLCIEVDWNTSPANIASLQHIFGKLVNVRKCVIDELTGVFDAGYHTPTSPSVLLDFLERQPLRELVVWSVDMIPPALILRMLTTAPIISFFDVHVGEDTISSSPSQNPSKVEDLLLENNPRIYTLLSQLQLKLYTQTLRRLSFRTLCDPDSKLIFATADTLEYVRFNLLVLDGVIPVPALPSLRAVEFSLPYTYHATPTFSTLALTVIDLSLQLADITISFTPMVKANFNGLILDVALLAAMDTALSAHPALPTIRWCLTFASSFGNGSAVRFAEFIKLVRRGMPKVLEARRLVVEEYSEHPQSDKKFF
ncbi:hypothetical protein MVEN_00377900 [Mycena venus]|uniref:Uncharacterized protein n=1 Tax=Mycena venus TaxID=2733690 RepID=A0A8H7DA08_9AGAR|nr:hypothetical protein MVEN_00377900 [Mycena venus]